MLCPKCKSDQVIVVDSREKDGTAWRRRECAVCKIRFNTKEIDEGLYDVFLKMRNIILSEKQED